MSHADLLSADAAAQMADFGETGAVYYPAAGGSRPITIIVLRRRAELADRPRMELANLQIQTLNDTTTGITAAEWTDGDKIDLRPHLGGDLKRLRLLKSVAEDAGLVTWEVA